MQVVLWGGGSRTSVAHSWVLSVFAEVAPLVSLSLLQTMQGDGPQLLLSEAVSKAAKGAGVKPLTSPESLHRDLADPALQEGYRQQVRKAPLSSSSSPADA